MVQLIVRDLSKDKYPLKATNSMKAKGYTLHNTYNDASAVNEITYMQRNDSSTSFTYAIDDKNVVQGLPLDRNGWHAGDGSNGYGNRNTYGVEICYSKSGGEVYDKSEDNAINFVAQGLYDNGWDISKVWKHKDWSGKNCPHRILARSRGWEGILDEIQKELDILNGKESKTVKTNPKKDISKKGVETLAREVIANKWGAGDERKRRLGDRYGAVQKRVNEIINGNKVKKDPLKTKGVETLAREVINNEWGKGDERKRRLGNRYNAVQKRVNEILSGRSKKPKTKSNSELAREVMEGKHGDGEARKKSLGNRYSAVQAIVNSSSNKSSKPKKSLNTLIDEVNRGVHGNGEDRKKSLGSDYQRVQDEINRRSR